MDANRPTYTVAYRCKCTVLTCLTPCSPVTKQKRDVRRVFRMYHSAVTVNGESSKDVMRKQNACIQCAVSQTDYIWAYLCLLNLMTFHQLQT